VEEEKAGGLQEIDSLQEEGYRQQPTGAEQRAELVHRYREGNQVDQRQRALEEPAGEPVFVGIAENQGELLPPLA
jgi:hypothetical protein